MDLDRLLGELRWAGDEALHDALATEWESSQTCFPSDALSFLRPQAVAGACQVLSLPADAAEALIPVAERVLSDPRLCALAWHFHHCAFRSSTYPLWGPIRDWPSVDALDGVLEGGGRALYLLILASGLHGMQRIYETRGIPHDVFWSTLGQLRDELSGLHEAHNVWGLSEPGRVQWYRSLLRGELFRLGRLSFQFGLFRWALRVFRHQASRAVVALAEGGLPFLPSGQADGPGRTDTAGRWVSELAVTDRGVTGHVILPTGRVLRRAVHLRAAEWQQVLARDDPALYVHIPEGGPLAHHLCADSFGMAVAFFRRHFPERPYACFCCDSWVLDSQLQELLPPTSNMVRFQREMYLLPHLTYDQQLADHILGGMPVDPGRAPRSTALQRALLGFITAGGRLHASAGAGFILPEDLRWGEQVYYRQGMPRLEEGACRCDSADHAPDPGVTP
jgi:hypothetical protein